MSDSCLEPGDARLVELTLAVHDIVLTNLILSQGNSDRLGGLPAQGILVRGQDLNFEVRRGSIMGLDLMVVHPGGAVLLLILINVAQVPGSHVLACLAQVCSPAVRILAFIPIADVAEVTPQVGVLLLTWSTVIVGALGRSSGVGSLKLPDQSGPATLYNLELDVWGGLLLCHLPHELGQHTTGGGLDYDRSCVATLGGPGPPGLDLLLPPLQLPETIWSVEWHRTVRIFSHLAVVNIDCLTEDILPR